ncbi:MAG: type II toxin-antitoxin system VapC family toxin [bacterium]|nr:type II toxin-antitoxin system VapC family toxin [bacterium]
MDFVIDASVAVAWSLEDEASALAEEVLDAIESGDGHAPAIWPFEVANALLSAERRKRIVPGATKRLLDALSSLEIEIDPLATLEHLDVELALAREHGLSVYDASYLSLAVRFGLPLATLDERLRTAAAGAGVALLVA